MATISNAISNVTATSRGVISHNPVAVDWDSEIIAEYFEEGDGVFTGSYSLFSHSIFDNISTVSVGSQGVFFDSGLLAAGISRVIINSYSDIYVTANKRNWVKWAKIGSLNFAIDKSNIAGERPVDWRGLVYAIKKLSNKVVVYGENGVSFLIPADTAYGLNTFYRVGLKGKNAVAGDESIHFFVDKAGVMWKLGESLQRIDYSEYFNSMSSNIVLTYDILNRQIYICDGGIGYVYDIGANSLGRGYQNISGISSQNNTFYVVSEKTLDTPIFELRSDIYDFGNDKLKRIEHIEIGADVVDGLQAAVDYRKDITDAFSTTPWVNVQKRGLAYTRASGREFKFRLRRNNYQKFSISYINITGIMR